MANDSPTPADAGEVREKVARIIDPSLWETRDFDATRRDYYELEVKAAWKGLPFEQWVVRGLGSSLAKADAILSLLPSPPVTDRYREGIEDAAKIVETIPDKILHMWERPGGPPGNGYAPTTRADIAAAIRALASGEG